MWSRLSWPALYTEWPYIHTTVVQKYLDVRESRLQDAKCLRVCVFTAWLSYGVCSSWTQWRWLAFETMLSSGAYTQEWGTVIWLDAWVLVISESCQINKLWLAEISTPLLISYVHAPVKTNTCLGNWNINWSSKLMPDFLRLITY